MTYRENIHNAYRTISDLESRLGFREAEIARLHRELVSLRASRPLTLAEPEATEGPSDAGDDAKPELEAPERSTRPTLLDAIPIPVTSVLAVAYAIRFGASLPTVMEDWIPFERASLLSAIAGGLVLTMRYLSLTRTQRSTIADRLLLVFGCAVALPFAVPVGFAAFSVGSVAFGVLTTVAAVGFALYQGVKWVATNET